jgi:hypothetical protein
VIAIGDTTPPVDSSGVPVDTTHPPQPPPPEQPPPPPTDSGPPHIPVHVGLPFGPENLWRDSARVRWGPAPFTASFNYNDPAWIVEEIEQARRMDFRVLLNMTGGKHIRYKTDNKFDLAKWKARMEEYNTPAIKAAVAAGVADGTIILNSVMDEPNVKSWGGVPTKAMLDDMARYVKNIFPTLPIGVALKYDWQPEEQFHVMDVIITQYNWFRGDINTYRDGALALAKRDGMAVAFGLNITDGGQYNFKTKECPIPLTGGYGSYEPACRMTPEQIREWGLILGPAGCGLFMFRFEQEFITRPANLQAFKDIADKLATVPKRPCRRGS